jgi:hypothetical protein
MADRVASLVTVGTPHRGTPIADLGMFALSPFGKKKEPRRDLTLTDANQNANENADGGTSTSPAPRRKKRRALVDTGGIRDARPSAMKRLNKRVPDDRGVCYGSVISAVDGIGRVNPLLVPGYLYISGKAGRNDGVVPADSQAWGEVMANVEADHWAVVGWSKNFDAPSFYASILRELAGRGF